MTLQVRLRHITEYRYDRLVGLSPQIVRLRPAPHCRTRILSYGMHVHPGVHFVNWQQDPYGNHLARLVFPEPTRELRIDIGLVAEMTVFNPFDFFLEPEAERFPFAYAPDTARELLPYLAAPAPGPRLQALADAVDLGGRPTIELLVDLNRAVQAAVRYEIRLEPGVQSPERTLELGRGSCRDSGWLLVQLLRSIGLAARFVSGYLVQLRADVPALDGPSGTEADFTDLHAWCEVYLPGAGWIGLDPTSGLLAGEGHIPLACTAEPSAAAPVSGAVDECEVEFGHHMEVRRILETPRVTFPYRDEAWQAIDALGRAVDERLRADDVRLTMGGEPTFVAAGDPDAPEWNTEALGPSKRRYGQDLLERLAERYGRGGFLHFGQGKWYPGEPLPRWALSLYWRADGVPAWSDPALLADERAPGTDGEPQARALARAIARELGLAPSLLVPAHEDAYYYLWRERRLPGNVDPYDSRLDDELERARLMRVFDQGLAAVVGYALPLRCEAGRWESGRWFLRDERLRLLPGDSPMGYRLPLDSLPWSDAGDRVFDPPLDPYADRAPLAGTPAPIRVGRAAGARPAGPPFTGEAAQLAAQDAAPARHASAPGVVRTALCVEPRQGRLHVFLPPLPRLEDYLALLAAVERACARLGQRVVLEGYAPPRDPRLRMLQVTPDPGVLEVNIHPAADWDELVDHTEFLYEAARQCRLRSEKFLLDGRHTGTGGGNHIVLGGATPADSPLLRRPDLVASLLAYWHNHPSLSYLFSGLFLGPTSQAPRVDEARNDQVYELEIALRELRAAAARPGGAPPWWVDRCLRNLLVDVTGNTHRAEFCIDKLYSPDGPTGRLGLLELRGFEMPPHARMSLVQQLLVRAIVARCWRTPFDRPLSRWGTALHDRFLLPSFLREDFDDVLADLARAGLDFDPGWFAPHFEFRFPRIGDGVFGGVRIELRAALEPWHVLGEEGAGGGTVRYVDSSLERIEVRVEGCNELRHAVLVNGEALPLVPTGRAGEFVAGLRFRAWRQASALHPGIGVHAPLTFDIVDTWNECSLGGCTYHVAHPGGRNFERFPVNANEAEGRRLARFYRHGHTPGRVLAPPARRSLEFPCTLDLRR